MGQILTLYSIGSTSDLLEEDIEELQEESGFSTEELLRMYERFKKLDTQETGRISVDALLAIPEFSMNPLVTRLAYLFEGVNFREFVQILARFRPDASDGVKLEFAFKIYDVDADGFISPLDLQAVIEMMVGSNLSEEQLAVLVDNTIKRLDTDGDGRISYEEFCDSVDAAEVRERLSMQISTL